MYDTDDKGGEMQLIHIKELEQTVAAKTAEIEKLQTRLKGYETIAKLAREKDGTNKELMKRIKDLEAYKLRKDMLEKQTSTESMPKSSPQPVKSEVEETNDMRSREGLNDLRCSGASTNHHTGSSSSFSIIGKSSRDLHIFSPGDKGANVTPSYHSFTDEARKVPLDEFNMSPLIGEVVKGEEDVTKSNNTTHKSAIDNTKDQAEPKSFDDYVQVFPQTSQSGGSDFYERSFEKEVTGGQSLLDSSKEGPRSMLVENKGSMSSFQYVEVNKDEKKKDAEPTEDPTVITFDATPSSKVPGRYDDMGARPKNSFQSKMTPNNGDETGEEGGIRSVSVTAESKQKLVIIPNEDRNYRINNAPMLPFGRGESQTEISALSSFGSDLDSYLCEQSIHEPEQYNDLNVASKDSMSLVQMSASRQQTVPRIATQGESAGQDLLVTRSRGKSSLSTQALKIRNILSSKTNISETRNIILPFLNEVEELERVSKEHEVENKQLKLLMTKIPSSTETGETEHPSALNNHDRCVVLPTNDDIYRVPKEATMRSVEEQNNALKLEIERLKVKTNQLHAANKEWKDRWELLKKQKEDENLQLKEHFVQEREKMKREADCIITSQREELQEVNFSKREIEKEMAILHSGKSQEKQLLEQLKQDYGTLHQEKRALEIQLETLKANNLEHSRPIECTQRKSDLETELSIVKRQVTLFMEDFNKEHQERISTENKLQKAKEAYQSLEAKLKKAHNMLKVRDDDLRHKAKQACDLQYEVDDLKLKLEIEQRRASIYPSMDVQVPSALVQQEHTNHVIPPNFVGTARNSDNEASTTKKLIWNCPSCTFQNKKEDKKCQMCLTPYKASIKYEELY